MKTIKYFQSTIREYNKNKKTIVLINAIKHYPLWLQSYNINTNKITDFLPWMNYEAISHLKKILHKEMLVFEYGSGYSTIFFALRTKKIVSIEHNHNWYLNVKSIFNKNKIENIEYKLIEPELLDEQSVKNRDFTDFNLFFTSDEEYKNYKFEAYVKEIDNYPDKFFDLIVIDGRARPACIKHSLAKVKSDGIILIDNTEREYYLKSLIETGLLSGWEIKTYTAHIPAAPEYYKTSFLRRILI